MVVDLDMSSASMEDGVAGHLKLARRDYHKIERKDDKVGCPVHETRMKTNELQRLWWQEHDILPSCLNRKQ